MSDFLKQLNDKQISAIRWLTGVNGAVDEQSIIEKNQLSPAEVQSLITLLFQRRALNRRYKANRELWQVQPDELGLVVEQIDREADPRWQERKFINVTFEGIHRTLNLPQAETVRMLAKNRHEQFEREYITDVMNLSDDDYDHLLTYLVDAGAVEVLPVDDSVVASSFDVRPAILELVRQLDNPPPRHRWNEFTAMFHNSRLSVPIMLIFVTVSFVGGFLAIVRFLMGK